jgi:hypothetical protein
MPSAIATSLGAAAGSCHLASSVVGVGFGTESNHGLVHFWLAIDVGNESSAAADEDDEQPGRERIERAGVADTSRLRRASNDGHDVVRGHARRFVDEQQPANLRRRDHHRPRVPERAVQGAAHP